MRTWEKCILPTGTALVFHNHYYSCIGSKTLEPNSIGAPQGWLTTSLWNSENQRRFKMFWEEAVWPRVSDSEFQAKSRKSNRPVAQKITSWIVLDFKRRCSKVKVKPLKPVVLPMLTRSFPSNLTYIPVSSFQLSPYLSKYKTNIYNMQ